MGNLYGDSAELGPVYHDAAAALHETELPKGMVGFESGALVRMNLFTDRELWA
jgi:hypothetical protein